MKTVYRFLTLLALLTIGNSVLASHYIGGDMTYRHISGNTYLVLWKVYRDCSGATIGNANLQVSRDTCGAVVLDVPMTQLAIVTGSPYCANVGNPCGNTGRPNYQELTFTATVTLPGPHPRWTFHTTGVVRPTVRNLTGSQNLHSRAVLNNTNNIINNSPQFNLADKPVPVVCYGEETTYSFNSIETDGDSLAFEFSRPMQSCNTAIPYSTYTPFIVFNADSSNFAVVPQGTFTPSFPLPSFKVDSSVNGRWRGRRFFDFDAATGSITFTPLVYEAGTAPALGRNKYVVCVRIREFRDINGVKVEVGWIQRDIMFIVEDCGGNKLPKAPNATVPPQTNSTVVKDSITEIKAQTCNITVAKILFRDPNPGDTLNVTFPYTSLSDLTGTGLVDSASLDSNNTSTPSLTIRIRPTRADVGRTYSFLASMEDNGCPIKGVQNRIIKITVVDSNFGAAVNAIGLPQDTVCRGIVVQLNARTLRPDTLRGAPQSYAYEWDDAIGLDPNDKFKRTLYVNPSRTTRYKVRIYSEGFPDCFDTASIEVKVRDSLKAGFDALYFQNSTGTALSNPIDISFKNTSTPRADIDSVKWSTYRVYRDGSAVSYELLDTLGTFERPIMKINDGGEFRISVQVWTRVNNRYICPSTYSENVVVPSYLVPNIITPNGDGRNDVFTTQSVSDVTSLKVFNRWGELVRDYDTYNNDFDGTGLNSGIYFFILESKIGLPTQKGWLEIMK